MGMKRSGWAGEVFRRWSSQDSVIDEGRHIRAKNYVQVSALVILLFIGSGKLRTLNSPGITVQS